MDYDNEINEQNITMNDAERIGEGLNAGGSILMAIGAAVLGVIGLIKLFSGDES